MLPCKLSQEDLNQMKQAFDSFDQNGDGKISEKEFQQLFDQQGLGVNENEMKIFVSIY